VSFPTYDFTHKVDGVDTIHAADTNALRLLLPSHRQHHRHRQAAGALREAGRDGKVRKNDGYRNPR
jgi:hypothetical protein